jgi:hypothetical protein
MKAAARQGTERVRRLTRKEYEAARAALVERLYHLITAYQRGMIVARTKEERELLLTIRRLLGPRRRTTRRTSKG